MKKCTYCGREYPDDAVACAIDAQPLAGGPKPVAASAPSVSPSPPAASAVVPVTPYSFPCPGCGSVAALRLPWWLVVAAGLVGGVLGGVVLGFALACTFAMFGTAFVGYRCAKCGKIPFSQLPPKAQTHFIGVWVIMVLLVVIGGIVVAAIYGFL